MKIYTKQGDQGLTSLGTGDRVSKNDLRVEAYGAIDELSSLLGLVRSYVSEEHKLKTQLLWIQKRLFVIGSSLAFSGTSCAEIEEITDSDLRDLELSIDKITKDLPLLTEFIVPGGTKVASYIHYARSVCRRVERIIVSLAEHVILSTHILPFLNRLSDYLFCAARLVNYQADENEDIAKI